MADGDQDDTELELDLETEQPGNQPEPEAEVEQPDEPEQPEEPAEPPPIAAQEPVAEQVQRPSRSQTRIQTLVAESQRKDTELAEVRRRLDELTRQVQKPAGETPEMRAQRRALMTPQEVMSEDLREAREGFTQQIDQMKWQNAEVADRTAFQAKAATNPLYAKYAPKVEGKLAELRTRGGNAEREVLLKYLIGEAALDKYSSKEGRVERTQAQQRVRRATTRPANSGSDEATTRRRDESLERRLENQSI